MLNQFIRGLPTLTPTPPLARVRVVDTDVDGGAAAADGGKKVVKKSRKGGLAALRARRRAGEAVGDDAPNDDDAAAPPGGINFVPMDGDDGEEEGEGRKIGAKKAAKLAQKEAKRQEREAAEREREDTKHRRELRYEEAQQARDAEEEQERLAEERKQAEDNERKRKEEEEYQAMKEMFSVDETGVTMDEDSQESQSKLEEFISFVKDTKVVMLEELAARFKLKTSDAIARLRSLQESQRLTGVMDDRGKFIYISDEEMKAVVKFMRQRGRVSISELADNSPNLISLKGVATES